MLFISDAHEDGANLAQRLYDDLKSADIRASGIFVVKETESGHVNRASHIAVLESLKRYYQPELVCRLKHNC